MVSCYLDLEEIRSAASSVVASIEGVMKEEKVRARGAKR